MKDFTKKDRSLNKQYESLNKELITLEQKVIYFLFGWIINIIEERRGVKAEQQNKLKEYAKFLANQREEEPTIKPVMNRWGV